MSEIGSSAEARAGFAGLAADGAESELLGASPYSKNYWDLVFEQLAKRKLFKIGMAVLALLYASAIYAPLIANDRPYVLEVIDLKGYRTAVGTLSAVASSGRRLAVQTPEEYLAARTIESAPETLEEALQAEYRAVFLRTDPMRTQLPEEHHGRLAEFEALFERGIEESHAGEGETARETFGEARTLARTLKKDLRPSTRRSRRPEGSSWSRSVVTPCGIRFPTGRSSSWSCGS